MALPSSLMCIVRSLLEATKLRSLRSILRFWLIGVPERERTRSGGLGVGERDLLVRRESGANVCSFLRRGVGLRLRRSALFPAGDRLLVERLAFDLRVAAVGVGMKVVPPLLLLLDVEDRRVRGGDLRKRGCTSSTLRCSK